MARLPSTNVAELLSSADTFAAAHPALAGALGARSTDAPLERVREAVAYLAAAAMDHTRALEAGGQRTLADAVAPDLLRPFPAATIVELSTEGKARRVPAGAEVHTRGERPCRFRVTGELRVGPWRVEHARIDRRSGERDALSFDLAATGTASLAEATGNRARFFVDSGRESALALVAHVLSHTVRVELRLEGTSGVAAMGGPHPYGTRTEQALLPEPDGPHTGMALLREYFFLPEKFCFFELGGFAAALRGSTAKRARVTLTFGPALPAHVTLGAGGVRAHCAPVVNLFRASAEPWTFEPGRSSAPLRVAGLPREEGGVYAVVGVSALARDDDAASPVPLLPLRRFAAGAVRPGFPYAYSTKGLEGVGGDPDVAVCLTSPRGRPPVLAPHVISTELLATNRSRASGVRPGELTEPGPGMPPGVRARNIVASCPYVPPPVGPELALQVAVRAAVPDGDPLFSLRSRLLGLAARRGGDPAAARGHVARAMAIESLDVETVADPVLARRGYEVRVSVDESPFQGLGDVALFVRLLQAALEAQTSVGHFVRVPATCTKSGARVVWPPEKP